MPASGRADGFLVNKFRALSPETRERLKRIRFLLMDVDGVLTDGKLSLSDLEDESKCYSTRDGFAIVWARKYGLGTGVISGRKSAGTDRRCRDLKMDEIQLGHLHKVAVFEEIAARRSLTATEIAFIGDDLIDIPLFQIAGIAAAPDDAHDACFRYVQLRLEQNGGDGAVREFIDLWLMATGQWDQAMQDILHGDY
jgi:3-deoxy-D-manno-octulosonate 8-phosphate phosphatase (KDO 8-P phosphatase)